MAFTVDGVPVPQGSKTVMPTARGRRAIDDNERTLKPWRSAVAAAARAAMTFHSELGEGTHGYLPPLQGPLRLDVAFVFPRPRAHYRTGKRAGELKPNAPVYCSTRPDLDKLLRAIGDALTGIAFVDDAQVVELVARKHYGSPAAHVELRSLT